MNCKFLGFVRPSITWCFRSRQESQRRPDGSAAVMAAWLPLLLCCATASADALPPNVPIHDRWSPLWHQPDHSRLSAGDVNAFFFFNGVCESPASQCVVSRVSLTQRIIICAGHLMTQWEMEVPNTYAPTPSTLPIVGWGHSVSTGALTDSHPPPTRICHAMQPLAAGFWLSDAHSTCLPDYGWAPRPQTFCTSHASPPRWCLDRPAPPWRAATTAPSRSSTQAATHPSHASLC